MMDEQTLRAKFYLAPKNITYDELVKLNEKYTAYPGLTLDQAKYTHAQLMEMKSKITHN
jgi:hypothetical protein